MKTQVLFPYDRSRPERSLRHLLFRQVLIFCFILAYTGTAFGQVPVYTATASTTPVWLPTPSFELPVVDSFEVDPLNQPYLFTGIAGVAANNSFYTGSTAAPDSNQVLFLRQNASVQARITIPSTGVYHFRLQAAQGAPSGNLNQQPQVIRISIGATVIGEFQPDGTAYQAYQSVPLRFNGQPFVLKVEALNPGGGDNFILLDDFQLEKLPLWSDPMTWDSALVPTETVDAAIPAGSTVVWDGTAAARHIDVNGELKARHDTSLLMYTKQLMVMGPGAYFEWGQERMPYLQTGTITLLGDSSEAGQHPTMGNKFIGAMMQGRIEIHGKPRHAWTQINATAQAGATSLILKDSVDWVAGDSIALASTDYDFRQAEQLVIDSVSADGKTLWFHPALSFMHWGDLDSSLVFQTPMGQKMVDERAEVGLLSRNLTIQGDATSEQQGFGGHIMTMQSTWIRMSGAALFRMGQEGIIGRYPFHWHICGDVPGQYIKNSAIVRSFNRVVTVHRSNYALVEDNVGYDHIGNGYFLEAGQEFYNVFKHNLGLSTKAPTPGKEVRPFDFVKAGAYTSLPATFWISHPTNDFIGNAAAGSIGSGYWFVNLKKPLETNDPIVPAFAPLGKFDDNRAHTSSFSNLAFDGDLDENQNLIDFGTYAPKDSLNNPYVPVINRFTSFRCRDRNLWMRTFSLAFNDCAFADNHRHTFFSYNNRLYNSLLVGWSNNIGTLNSANEIAAGRSLPLSNQPADNVNNTGWGMALYDGPWEIDSIYFAGYNDEAFCFVPNGAALKSTNQFSRNIFFDSLTVNDTNRVNFATENWKDEIWATGLLDITGDLNGTPGMRLTPRIYGPFQEASRPYDSLFNAEPLSVYYDKWTAWHTPYEHYSNIQLENKIPGVDNGTPIYAIRSDQQAVYNVQKQTKRTQVPAIVNQDYSYYFQYHKLPYQVDVKMDYANNGDEIMAVLVNIPSSTYISSLNGHLPPIGQASSLAELENADSTAYYFADNTAWFKLVGNFDVTDPQYGDTLQGNSKPIRLCQLSTCGSGTNTVPVMPVADYEMGRDSRAILSTNGDLNTGTISSDVGADPYDGNDDKNYFTLTTDGDGVDEWIAYELNFFRQVWNDFSHLYIHYSGPEVQVLLKDMSEGLVDLGTYTSTQADSIHFEWLNTRQRDEITGIVLRFRESSLGKLDTILSQQIALAAIELELRPRLWHFGNTMENWEPLPNFNQDTDTSSLLHVNLTNTNGFMAQDLWNGFLDVNEGDAKVLKVRMRNSSPGDQMRFQWQQLLDGPIGQKFEAITPNSDFQTYTMDLNGATNWANDMGRLQFYPSNRVGSFDLDYMALLPDANCETCWDGEQNGTETGVDCGGDCPFPCPLPDPVWEIGRALNVGDSWVPIPFQNTYDSAVVIATPELIGANQAPVIARVRNVTDSGFELKVQRPGGSTPNQHAVQYFVVEAGSYQDSVHGITLEAGRMESSETAGAGNWVMEGRTYQNTYLSPVVLGQVITENDPDWSVFWGSKDGTRSDPPTNRSLAFGKHVGEDSDDTRANETIGYVVIESGSYSLNGQTLAAGLGADKITGVGDIAAIVYPGGYSTSSYNVSGLSSIEHAVLSSSGMDGNNGGWPVLYSNAPISGNNLNIRIDEDQIQDNERSHSVKEQVAWLAVGTSSSKTASENSGQPSGNHSTSDPDNGLSGSEIEVVLIPNPLMKGNELQLLCEDPELALGLKIFTQDGKLIYTGTLEAGSKTRTVPLKSDDLTAGLYFVHVKYAGKTTVRRLVVVGK